MSKTKTVEAQPVAAQMLAIKPKDDIFVVRRKRRPLIDSIFFNRVANGAINVIWQDPNVEVISLGSAKERRARWAQAEARRKRRAQAEARRKRWAQAEARRKSRR